MNEEIREQLIDALTEIDRPGSFCVSGSAPAVLPGLEVAGLGQVGLPLSQKQAKELIKFCKQAPYGKGEKTLVDRNVRRVWRMEPDRFSLKNPEWDLFLATTVGRVQEGLGLENQKLESHLYDLLLYEPGSFFLPHRDGEKLNRMVATLLVVLPSTYEGGELVVRHDGRKKTIDFRGGAENPFDIHFAAFYADCEHEVRPLRKGYRLCLVYNLVLAKSKQTITAPREWEHIERIGRLLEEWAADKKAGKLVITLDHRYTEAGLGWDALKGTDRARASILNEAAKRANCKAYVALLTLHESGEAEDDGYGPYDEDEYEDEDYTMGEVYESSLTATSWSDSDGNPLPIGELNVGEAEILEPDALRDTEPEQEYEGYMGNEGMTLERWYRHASIVIWPERRHFEILCDRNGEYAVPELERMVAQLRHAKPADATALKARCLEFAKAIFKTWRVKPWLDDPYSYRRKPEPGDFLDALGTIGDPKLIGRYFRNLLAKDMTLDPGNSVATVCDRLGWATFQDDLVEVMESTSGATLERNTHLLEQICSSKSRKKTGWRELCEALATPLVAALERIDRRRPEPSWRAPSLDRAKVLAGFVRSLILSDQTDLLSRILTHALAMPKCYRLTSEHMAALSSLRPWLDQHVKRPCAALTAWLASCRGQLETLTAQAPEAPKTFRRAAKLTCKCKDCAELKRFLEDPHESVHRFRTKQERRNHLANTIRDSRSDLDLKTDQRGSPHTLICTKNLASYHEKLKEYHRNQEHLAMVRAVEAGLAK